MDIKKMVKAVKLCGSTPKVDQCKQCAYWSGGDMSKCIPRMTTAAATALSTLQAENEKLRAELEQVKEKYDAAIEWIQWFAESIDRPCEACKHNNKQDYDAYCKGCGQMGAPSCNWQWSGPQKED